MRGERVEVDEKNSSLENFTFSAVMLVLDFPSAWWGGGVGSIMNECLKRGSLGSFLLFFRRLRRGFTDFYFQRHASSGVKWFII